MNTWTELGEKWNLHSSNFDFSSKNTQVLCFCFRKALKFVIKASSLPHSLNSLAL